MHLITLSSLALALVGQTFAVTPVCNNVNLMWDGSQCVPSCPKLNIAVTALKQQATASAFCSSYLSIPVVTSTLTSTSTLTTTSTSTYTSGSYITTDATITVGATATTTVSTTITSTATPYITLTQTACMTTSVISSCAPTATAAARRRGIMPVAMAQAAPAVAAAAANIHKPVALAAFNAGPALSSACACLSNTASTTYVTASTSSTRTIPTSTTVPSTIHATSTLTSTNTLTSTLTFRATVTSTQTFTSTITSSVNGLAFPTFAIRVQGGDNAGKYVSNSGTSVIDSTASSPAAGLAFSLNSSCNLYVASGPYAGDEIIQDANYASDPQLYINSGLPASRLRYFTCDVVKAADGTCPMTCTGALNGGSTIWDCGVYWRIGLAVPPGCSGWTPLVVGSV